MTATTGEPARPAPLACQHRAILDRIGDKWAIYVVARLGPGPMRFTELQREIGGIAARMLTVTLRGLERDGIVSRTMHPVIPPRVDYELTPLGRTLLDTIGGLITWAADHSDEVAAARTAYDERTI
jgi:DNA-binding HxlR family transcriptional regulator